MTTRARSIVDAGMLLQQFKLLCERRQQAPDWDSNISTSMQIGLLAVELRNYYHISGHILNSIREDVKGGSIKDTTPD